MNYIPKNIRFLRKLAGLSQEQFAQKVNMNRGNIASYEKGSAEPSIEKLQRIIAYFKVNLEAFVEEDLSKRVSQNTFPPQIASLPQQNTTTDGKGQPVIISESNLYDMETEIIHNLQKINAYKLNLQHKQQANIQNIMTSMDSLTAKVEQLIEVQTQILSKIKDS